MWLLRKTNWVGLAYALWKSVNYTTPNEGYNGNVALQMLYESGVDYTTPNEEYSGNVWYYKWQSHSWIAW